MKNTKKKQDKLVLGDDNKRLEKNNKENKKVEASTTLSELAGKDIQDLTAKEVKVLLSALCALLGVSENGKIL